MNMKNKSPDSRSWSDVDDEELSNIISQNPDKHLRRMAKAEQRKRNRAQKIVTRPVEGRKANQVEIVAINLSVKNWIKLITDAIPAIIIATIVIRLVNDLVDLWQLNQFLKGLSEALNSVR
jgi:ribosomal protein L2